ncbi:DUF454 family protein [Streptococcus sp. DD12]|uniref:DUF454 family protein n=1 Tax=Streptococcus sp. DD12 TaxID=1777880 RepID=UPI0007951A07|nr:DUF454 family protein [Streptococcus sp. DD12]KXT75441.1 hypothetical protein STRDD12_01252 [Streptococcus sp. DD12]
MRIFYGLLGILNILLGILGSVLPIMPGFIFYFFALICFMRMSPRFKQWVQRQSLYRKLMKQMHQHRKNKRLKQMAKAQG